MGPEHLDQIFESSRWVFSQDLDMGFEVNQLQQTWAYYCLTLVLEQIFTSVDVELPRAHVVDFLEKIDLQTAARYIEYLIEEKQEEEGVFHDRLAELYLNIALAAKKAGDDSM